MKYGTFINFLASLHLLLLCSWPINALYFYLSDQNKCFFVEVPSSTLVVGNYKCEYYSVEQEKFILSLPGFGMHVRVWDPLNNIILSKAYGSKGIFSFTSHEGGTYYMCLSANGTKEWLKPKKIRVHFNTEVGERAIDYEQLSKKEHLNRIELRVRQLLEQAKYINSEQQYQRVREERFRRTSESVNRRVYYLGLPQLIILVLMGIFQVWHLKKFFLAKKLV